VTHVLDTARRKSHPEACPPTTDRGDRFQHAMVSSISLGSDHGQGGGVAKAERVSS